MLVFYCNIQVKYTKKKSPKLKYMKYIYHNQNRRWKKMMNIVNYSESFETPFSE